MRIKVLHLLRMEVPADVDANNLWVNAESLAMLRYKWLGYVVVIV
jgi:hypothetical protein